MVRCDFCGAENSDFAERCVSCGARLKEESSRGSYPPPSTPPYEGQGYYQQQPYGQPGAYPPPPPPPGYQQPYPPYQAYPGQPPYAPAPYVSACNRWVAFLLCLFLGYLGIHRFYVGKSGTGILYIFTVGLFGIGWLVDLIMIASGSFRDRFGLVLMN